MHVDSYGTESYYLSMKAKAPYWDLARVQALAAQPQGLFVQVTRAAAFFGSPSEALATLRTVIAQLTWKDFAETQQLTWDTADVYGIRMADASGWYLKITVDEEIPEVVVISCHPLAHPLRTNGGVVKP